MRITISAFARTAAFLALAALLISAKPTPRPPRAPSEKQIVAANLATFDDLDFNVFSNQKWDQVAKSHAPDIIVHWPDGHMTNGLAAHLEDLKAMKGYAPDMKITAHPVKFGSGEWTCVIGTVEGTFTRPMSIGHARSIQPTMRRFRYPMTTIGRWRNGVMVEEFLFWDTQAFTKQVGL